MNANPKVSIIIPVFKVELYIERCARSLFDQTFDEIEFIFVNDHSPDKSIRILENVIEQFPQRKNQIRIIHHENNQGIAAVRNTGLNNAHGEYFLQVDSDDWVEATMIEELYTIAKMNDADIVWADYYVDFPNNSNTPINRKQNVPENAQSCIIETLSGTLHAGLWNKLLKRNLCVANNLRFPDGVNMCEDLVFIIIFLMKAERVSSIQKAFYHYVQIPNSISIARSRQSFESEFKAVAILEKTIPIEDYGNYLLKYKARVKRNLFFSTLFNNDEFLSCFPECDKYIYDDLGTIKKLSIFLSLKKYFVFARITLAFARTYSNLKQFILQ